MTKVTLHYDLTRALTEDDWENIAALPATYGLTHVYVAPTGHQLGVDYDASRLMRKDVEAVLTRHGLPIRGYPSASSQPKAQAS